MKLPTWLQRFSKRKPLRVRAQDPDPRQLELYEEAPLTRLAPPEFAGAVPVGTEAVYPLELEKEDPAIKNLQTMRTLMRQRHRDPEAALNALSIHIQMFEDHRSRIAAQADDFLKVVNSTIQKIAQPEIARSLRTTTKKATAILYKIYSSLAHFISHETDNPLVRYGNVIYGIHQAMQRPTAAGMPYTQFAEWYLGEFVPRKTQEGFVFQNVQEALLRAWENYEQALIRVSQASERVNILRRYGQEEDASEFEQILEEVQNQIDAALSLLDKEIFDLEEEFMSLAAEWEEEEMEIAASLKIDDHVVANIGLYDDGIVKNVFGKVLEKTDSGIFIVTKEGISYDVKNSRIVKAQVEDEEGVAEFFGFAPPEEPVVETPELEIPEARGRPVEPPEAPKPPPPGVPPPKLPLPEEFKEVEIPEEVWEKLPQAGRIRWAAVNRRLVELTYVKQGSPPDDPEVDVTKTYVVEPYSYRIKTPKSSGRVTWYLFGFDVFDFHIKAFIVRRIESVEVLDDTFSPRWEVEF